MSFKIIKSTLETYLNDNYSSKAIKWRNTTVYTLDKTVLDDDEISNLTEYINPFLAPVSSTREMSGGNGIKYKAYFQINIYIKKNIGTGSIYDIVSELENLYREKIISDVVCSEVEADNTLDAGEWIVTPLRVLCHLYGN